MLRFSMPLDKNADKIQEVTEKQQFYNEFMQEEKAKMSITGKIYTQAQLIARFAKEYTTWLKSKKPIRPDNRVAELFEICRACEHFRPDGEKETCDKGSCGLCGCNIKKTERRLNKLNYATTKCPDNPPRWIQEPGYEDQEHTDDDDGGFTVEKVG